MKKRVLLVDDTQTRQYFSATELRTRYTHRERKSKLQRAANLIDRLVKNIERVV